MGNQNLCPDCTRMGWCQRPKTRRPPRRHPRDKGPSKNAADRITSFPHHRKKLSPTAPNMKLHLPKQLFTALLAAITLAAPAALTLGSTAWGLSVSYEKSFSTTGGTDTPPFTSEDGAMTYDYSTGTLTLAGDSTASTTIDFSMLYTWEESEDVVFLRNTAGSVSGLVAKTDGTIKGKAAGNNNYGTAKDKSLLLEAYEKSGNNDNTIRVTSTINSSSGVTLTACDISEELYRASDLKYSSATWSSLVFDSRIVTNVYYSVAEGTEGANTVITSSDAKWKKSYATVVFNKADTKAVATVLNEVALKVEYNSDALSNLGNDIIVGGSGQLHLQTWGGNNNARNRDIDISAKKLYLDSSTQSSGALRLGVYCGDITLGDIHLIGDTKITKESSNAESQVIFAGDVYGNYALTLAPDRSSDKFDGVVFTGNVDVKALNIAAGSEILFSGTVGRANKTNAQFTINGGSVEFQNTSYIGSIATSGGANLTFSGKNVVHTVLGDLTTEGSMGALTINAGTTLNVNGSLSNTWGMSGGIVANGTLDANVLSLKYDTSEQSVSGTGSVEANQFITGNHGTYRVSVSELTGGAGGFSVGYDGRKAQVYLSSENATINGAVTIAADSKLEVSGGSTSINNNVSGVGALEISGGSLTLNGERNSIGSFAYTGGALYYTTLTAGSATINGESTLSNSGHLTVTGTLAGSIENKAAGKVTLASGMSITADTNVSITGAGITEFGGTLTNNGTLTLGGVISLSGDINQHYVVREAAGETALYATDRFNTAVTNTDGNGFKLTSGGSYWLVQGGTTNLLDGISSREGYTITQVTDANKAEGERVGDVYISSVYNAGREFYVSIGSVQVNADQQAATSYTLQGGSMIITDGSVSASAITCDGSKYTTTSGTTGIITVGAGAELLLDTMPGAASLLNLLKGEGMVNAESAGRLVVTTAQSLGGSPETTYKGKLEIVGARLSIGAGQHNTNKLSSLSEIILNDGGNIFYNGKDDGNTSVMDFQKITVEFGTGEFHLEDSGASAGNADTIQFGEIAVAAGATMQLTSRWQDSAYYVDKLTGAGEFHAKSATDSGLNKKLTVNNLAGFSGDLVFTNAGAGFEQVTVKTGSSEVNFRSLSVNDVQGFTFNVQADTTIGLLSATSGTVDVYENKTLTLGGGTVEAQKQHSIGMLTTAAGAGISLGDYATLELSNIPGALAESYTGGNVDTDSSLKLAISGGTGSVLNLALDALTSEGWQRNSTVTLTQEEGSALAVRVRSGYLANCVFGVNNAAEYGSYATTNLGGSALSMADGTSLVLRKGHATENFGAGDISLEGAVGLKLYGSVTADNTKLTNNISGGTLTLSDSGGVTFFGNLTNLILVNEAGAEVKLSGETMSLTGLTQKKGTLTVENNKTLTLTGDASIEGGTFAVSGTLDVSAGTTTLAARQSVTVEKLIMDKAAAIVLNEGAELHRGDVITITGSGEQGRVSVTTDNKTYSVDDSDIVLQNVDIAVNSSSARNVSNQLQNSSVSNVGTGTLKVQDGDDLTVVNATSGSIEVNDADSAVSIANVSVGAGEGRYVSVQNNALKITATDSSKEATMVRKDGTTGALAQLQEDASFTIQDMTLSNVKLSAAQGTTVALNNLSGSAELAGAGHFSISGGEAQYTLAMSPVQAQVAAAENEKGSALTLSYASSTAITLNRNNEGSNPTLALSVDPTLDVNGVFGAYDVTLTLSNFGISGAVLGESGDLTALSNAGITFTGWLGDALSNQTTATALAEAVEDAPAAPTAPTVSYTYTPVTEGSNVGTLVITINGLNVPEPASATLGLAALMMLCARRRRKA